MAYFRNKTQKKPAAKNRSCYEAALSLLKYKDNSEKELFRKLLDREYSEKEIEETLAKLRDVGYVDDETLADDLFEAYRQRGAYGDRYIHQKLKEKGLATEKHLSPEEEQETAANLLRRKAEITPALKENYKKAAAFLLRRGFTTDAVSYAFRSIGEEAEWEG